MRIRSQMHLTATSLHKWLGAEKKDRLSADACGAHDIFKIGVHMQAHRQLKNDSLAGCTMQLRTWSPGADFMLYPYSRIHCSSCSSLHE